MQVKSIDEMLHVKLFAFVKRDIRRINAKSGSNTNINLGMLCLYILDKNLF